DAGFGRGSRRRIFTSEHDPLVGTVGILERTAHFHFNLVDERVAFGDLRLEVARRAEERAEFPRAPAGEGWLVFALEMMPAGARFFQPDHRFRAIRRGFIAYRRLIDQDEFDPGRQPA
ncbi:MAG TPA: hypothetical protein VGF73_07730, partial [Chthoniobacterales bacterium]